MTKDAAFFIREGLSTMEEGVFLLSGPERQAVCGLMQSLQNLVDDRVNLETSREALRQFHGRAWPATV